MVVGIIVAGGKSERMGASVDKAFVTLGNQAVLVYSLQAFDRCPDVDAIVLVVRKDRLETARGMVRLYGCGKVASVVAGGPQRQASVSNGLAMLSDEADIVAVHDGARPLVTPELISHTIKSARAYGSGVAAVKIVDTVKEAKGLTVTKTVDRSKLWAVQTPQTFKRDLLMRGYAEVAKRGKSITDEASAVELLGEEVRLVPSSWSNIKITSPGDIAIAAALLKA